MAFGGNRVIHKCEKCPQYGWIAGYIRKLSGKPINNWHGMLIKAIAFHAGITLYCDFSLICFSTSVT
ncbi:MAG: hypothetical protein Ct9H300mP27_06290 [Chloroflexota bacterium]|nr:MAG: hypothetical protein Ct9H300mP27_06290 [Chloroflexota bacterium]